MKIYTKEGIVAIAFAVLPNLSRLIPQAAMLNKIQGIPVQYIVAAINIGCVVTAIIISAIEIAQRKKRNLIALVAIFVSVIEVLPVAAATVVSFPSILNELPRA